MRLSRKTPRARLLKKRALWLAAALLPLFGLAAVLLANRVIQSAARGRCFADIGAVPRHRAGLVLGSARSLKSGALNLHYKHRVETAAALFHAGKVDYLLVSGDNSRAAYNEPADMRDDLVAAGVPADRVYLDYAGFRTLDSVVRAKKIFRLGDGECLVISQKFHVERALYLAQKNGLRASGFIAPDPPRIYTLKVKIREQFARLAACADVNLLGTQPRFLGPPVPIGPGTPQPPPVL
jgi:SanA protein